MRLADSERAQIARFAASRARRAKAAARNEIRRAFAHAGGPTFAEIERVAAVTRALWPELANERRQARGALARIVSDGREHPGQARVGYVEWLLADAPAQPTLPHVEAARPLREEIVFFAPDALERAEVHTPIIDAIDSGDVERARELHEAFLSGMGRLGTPELEVLRAESDRSYDLARRVRAAAGELPWIPDWAGAGFDPFRHLRLLSNASIDQWGRPRLSGARAEDAAAHVLRLLTTPVADSLLEADGQLRALVRTPHGFLVQHLDAPGLDPEVPVYRIRASVSGVAEAWDRERHRPGARLVLVARPISAREQGRWRLELAVRQQVRIDGAPAVIITESWHPDGAAITTRTKAPLACIAYASQKGLFAPPIDVCEVEPALDEQPDVLAVPISYGGEIFPDPRPMDLLTIDDACDHRDGGHWYPLDDDQAIALGCAECGRRQIVAIGRHRIPEGAPGVPSLGPLLPPDRYMARERALCSLLGRPAPQVSYAALVRMERLPSLDPSRFACDTDGELLREDALPVASQAARASARSGRDVLARRGARRVQTAARRLP